MRAFIRLAGVLQLLLIHGARAQRTAATSDPAITYRGDWELTAGKASHVAMQPGSTATFVFQGTSVKFRSTRAWLQSVEQLSLDGRTVMVDMSWPDASVSGDTVVVWQATGLSMSQHTVVITKVSPADKWMVVWDFIYDDGVPTYQPGAPVSPTSSRQRSTPISPSTTSSTPLQGTVSSSTSSQLDPSNPYSASSSSTTDLISSASSSVESASSASPSPSASSSSSTSGMSSQSGTTVVSSGGSSPAIDGPSTPEGLEATSSAAGTSGGALPAESASAINKESDSNGALIGGIVASVLAAICAVLAGLLCRRRRRKQQSQQQMAQIAGGSMPFGSEAFQRHDRDRNQAMSLHSADPLSTVDSPSSFLPPTPAQEYASLARATTSPISPGSDFEYPASSTLMSEATGRRERPPTYISTCPRVQGTGQRPADLALYIDTSSHSLYGDLRRGKSG